MLLVVVSIVLVAVFWAQDFYRLWIGQRYLTGVPFQSVALLFQILMISVATDYSSNIASLILTGSGRVRTVALALAGGSFLNVTLSILLIPRYGLAGIAAATVTASIVVDLIAMPFLLQQAMRLSVVGFLRSACLRPLIVAAGQAAFFTVILASGRPARWIDLLAQGAVAAIGSIVILVAVGITRDERERFVVTPFRRLKQYVSAIPTVDVETQV